MISIGPITGLPQQNTHPILYSFMLDDFQAQQFESALPDYRFVRCIGEGAYGKVFLLEKRANGQMFAVKRISCFGLSEYELANALNEVRVLASLDHPNIVKFYDGLFDKEHDHLYIFLEYANGGDLAQLIEQAKQRKKRVSEQMVWKVLLNVGEAVEYLHQHQIAHRDIKPANIFRDKEKGFKLGDLNVSKVLPQGSMARTRTGSPFYISPEVWDHKEEGYGYKCDIWSLGVVIYELCCLRVPFEVDSPQEMAVILRKPLKRSLSRHYSSALNEIVEGMLQIDPKKRISAEHIISACRKNLHMNVNSQRKIRESDVLMQTIVVPETNQRWVNLVHIARKPTRELSMSSRNSSYGRKSEIVGGTIDESNLLGVPGPQMIKRASRTSKGSRKASSKPKDEDLRLPSLRKYSCDAVQIDFAKLSLLIERKSEKVSKGDGSASKASKNSESPMQHSGIRSRIRRNMVCEYIKQVREDLLAFE